MKKLSRTLALALALTILATLTGSVALAASPKVISLKMGTWYSLKTEKKSNSVFKLTLSQDSLLSCKTRGPEKDDDILEFELFDNKNCDWSGYVGGFGISGGSGTNTHRIAVSKGTYYLKAYTHSSAAKLKITGKAVARSANTTRAKAETLKKSTVATVIQFPDGAKKLWYKIKLTKKQSITVDPQAWSGYEHPGTVSIYNAKNKKVPVAFNKSDYVYKTKSKQPAGMYYICVRERDKYTSGEGGYMKFLWR